VNVLVNDEPSNVSFSSMSSYSKWSDDVNDFGDSNQNDGEDDVSDGFFHFISLGLSDLHGDERVHKYA
jgi:hypothetical protein